MKPLYRVLWVEDGALIDLPELVGPVYVSGRYDLSIALNATDGAARIVSTEYDVVVVDIRLPPGTDPRWVQLFKNRGLNKAQARLGLKLLSSCLDPINAEIKLSPQPLWLNPSRFAVFTVEGESELQSELAPLGIRLFQQKKADPSREMLLDLLDRVIETRAMRRV